MKPDLIYDDDLRGARRWALILGLCNLTMVALNIYQGYWLMAIGGGFWAMTCGLWRKLIAAQQKTRDMGRVIEAGVHSRRVMETGEFF
jgi:hypothetical protein